MSPPKKLIRLLLVDDHEVVRVGLRAVLHNNQGMLSSARQHPKLPQCGRSSGSSQTLS